MSGAGPDRVDAYFVAAGKYHDIDFARRELLGLLAEHPQIRTTVAPHFEDIEALSGSDFLISYTCDLRPSIGAQHAIRSWVEEGGRWLALHGTNAALYQDQMELRLPAAFRIGLRRWVVSLLHIHQSFPIQSR